MNSAKSKMPPRHALAVDQHVLFVEVPAARTHLQRRDLVVELVGLAALLERQRAADRLAEVDLALDLVVHSGELLSSKSVM